LIDAPLALAANASGSNGEVFDAVAETEQLDAF
jgi:hypothetical protein